MPFSKSKFTGFPFDDTEYDHENTHFQSRLNDIAQRHPEFASHLRFDDFPSLRRKRYGSNSSAGSGEDLGQGTASASRFADHHQFPSGFTHRFPFTAHFEEDFGGEPRRETKPPEVPRHEKRGRRPNPNLPQHLSNTVDLGQKQPPVEESRSQRSMSAPPENRTSQSAAYRDNQQSFPQQQHPAEAMGSMHSSSKQQPSQNQRESTPTQPKEHYVPITIEGTNRVIIPNASQTGQGTANQQQSRQHFEHPKTHQQQQGHQASSTHQPSPQFQAPPTHHHQGHQQNQHKAPPTQHTYPQPPPTQHTYPQPPPTQQSHPQAHPTQQKQSTPPPPPPPAVQNDSIEKIKCIKNDVMDLMSKVQNFKGTRKDREYLYLDEMLTRNLLKLDNIETEGKEDIRNARKEAIKCIQQFINSLESQAKETEVAIAAAEAAIDLPTETSDDHYGIDVYVPETQQPSQSPKTFKTSVSIPIVSQPLTEVDKSESDQPMDAEPVVTSTQSSEPTAEMKSEAADANVDQTSSEPQESTSQPSSSAQEPAQKQ